MVIFDEAHVAIDQQKTIIDSMPKTTKAIGISATPERTDGRGLSDIYESIVYGPTLEWLIQHGYLSDMRYYSPPIEGINDLKRHGAEFDEEELDALLSRRAVYGQSIEHYKRLADKKPCIVFCRSIKASKETAQKFCNAGYRFEDIDGTMSDKKRDQILDGLASGKIHGITTVDLVCYGLDIPVVECIVMLRPTLSKPLFFQMIGRGLRKSEGKEFCTILDHVGNLSRFGYPKQDTEWNFYGKEKKNYIKTESEAVLKMCPNCFLYFEGTVCPYCGHSGHREKNMTNR